MQNGRAARRAEGDADNYSRTLSHRRRLTLQTDWQMKRAEIASIKKTATCQNRGIISNILSQMGNGKKNERAWEIEPTIQHFTKAI